MRPVGVKKKEIRALYRIGRGSRTDIVLSSSGVAHASLTCMVNGRPTGENGPQLRSKESLRATTGAAMSGNSRPKR